MGFLEQLLPATVQFAAPPGKFYGLIRTSELMATEPRSMAETEQ